jgi:hypothetical protein
MVDICYLSASEMSVGGGQQSRILRFDVLRKLALLKSVNSGNLELKKTVTKELPKWIRRVARQGTA